MLAHAIWSAGHDGSDEDSLSASILGRTMAAAFFAMASMMFSMALYASACYPAEQGSTHALGPLAPLCQWIAFGLALPVLPLLAWPLVLSSTRRFDGPGGSGSVNLLILS